MGRKGREPGAAWGRIPSYSLQDTSGLQDTAACWEAQVALVLTLLPIASTPSCHPNPKSYRPLGCHSLGLSPGSKQAVCSCCTVGRDGFSPFLGSSMQPWSKELRERA